MQSNGKSWGTFQNSDMGRIRLKQLKYNDSKKMGKAAPASYPRIYSVYFDTEDLALYKTRLLQMDYSMLFRYRMYGKNIKDGKGFMEQKIRKPQWRCQSSIKRRFPMRADQLPRYLRYADPLSGSQSVTTDPLTCVHSASAGTDSLTGGMRMASSHTQLPKSEASGG
eukprot:116210_1